jgi:hypothetical protein
VLYPTTSNPITFPKPAGACGIFRLQEVTNQVVLGNYYVGSMYAATNGLGSSAMILFDPSSPHLVMWDRAHHVTSYTIPDFDVTDAAVSCELAFASGHLVIARNPGNSLSLKVTEYAFNGGQLTIVTNFSTGNSNCRWMDAVTLSSGQISIVSYQQTNGLVGWFVHRTAAGAWVDDGERVIVPGYPNSSQAGIMRQCENPADHSLWVFGNKDGDGAIQATRIAWTPGFNIVTNFTLASDAETSECCPDRIWFNDTNAAPHPEYLESLRAMPDWTGKRMLVCYPNRMGGQSWDAAGQHWIVTRVVEIATDGANKTQVALSPGVTERTDGGIVLGPSRLYYVPMSQAAMPYFPLTVYGGSSGSTLLFPLIWYSNVYQVRDGKGVVATRDDGAVVVTMD